MASEHDTLVKLILDHANASPISMAINTRLERSKRTVAEFDKGRPDVTMFLFGFAIFIEVKIPPDTQRKTQKEFESRATRAMCKYWIVKSFDEYLEKYKAFQDAYALIFIRDY